MKTPMLLHRDVSEPCADCGHAKQQHFHYPGANLNPGHWGECLMPLCGCRLYAYPKREEKAA